MNCLAISKRKLRFIAINFALIILAVASLIFLCSCADNGESSTSLVIEGVTVDDVIVPYDGKSHTLIVKNALIDDEIAYSTDGTTWTTDFFRSEIGEYNVSVSVRRSGYEELILRAYLIITPNILDGVTASDVTVIYDAKPHGISVSGVRADDIVTFSADGENFSQTPVAYTEVGRYTIYYRVERGVAYFADSCTVTVLPDILGEYINIESGATVEITPDTVFDIDGTGEYNGKPFAVEDGLLVYDGKEYRLLEGDEVFYTVAVGGSSVSILGGDSIAVDIVFDALGATVDISGKSVYVENVNYCEPIDGVDIVRDYEKSDVRFETSLTDIVIVLSNRPTLALPSVDLYFIYDGAAHDVFPNVSDTVLLKSDDGYSKAVGSESEVGRYSFEYVVLRDGYLPSFVTCELVIYPAFDGVYVTESDIIFVTGEQASVNGEETAIVCDGNGISIGDKSVDFTDGGIVFDGIAYSKGEGSYVVIVAEQLRRVVAIEDVLYIHISDNSIVLYYELVEGKNGFSLEDSVPIAVFDIGYTAASMVSNGKPLTYNEGVYIIGVAEIESGAAWIEAVL